jgi:hypothetical protein
MSVGDEGATALSSSPHLRGLTALQLGGNSIGPEGRETLRARFGDRVLF